MFSFFPRREITGFEVVRTTWTIWRQMFNFIVLPLKRWFEFYSGAAKTIAVTSVVSNMSKAERNVLLGARRVTVVKVEIISSLNARRYMQCLRSKILMTIMMNSGAWL